MNRKTVGNRGENAAVQFLEAHGYRILDRNVRPLAGMARGELDIIAWDNDVLCFIEVKTRQSLRSVPAENITTLKQRQLVALTEAWLSRNEAETQNVQIRFDVVSVFVRRSEEAMRISLMRDAFRP